MIFANHPSSAVLTDFWVRCRWAFFATGLLLLLAILFFGPRISAPFSIDKLLPPNHPKRIHWERLRQIFGDDEFIVVVYRDPELFREDGIGLKRIRKIRNELRKVPGILDVWDIEQPLGNLILQKDLPLSQHLRRLFEGYTHNSTGDLCAIVVVANGSVVANQDVRLTIAQVQAIIDQQASGVVLGPVVLIQETLHQAERDANQLLWLAAALLAVVILLISRQMRWVLTSVIIIGTTILATQATISWAKASSGLMAAPLSSMITVIGVATLMHIQIRFQSYRDLGYGNELSFAVTIRQLGKPVILAIITDCVGFGALRFSEIEPLREFSFFAISALGWLTASLVFFLPAMVVLDWRRPAIENLRLDIGERFVRLFAKTNVISGSLLKIGILGFRRPVLVVLGTAALCVFSTVGFLWLEVETDFTRYFRKKNWLVSAYELVENELGGAGVWDIAVPAPQKINRDYLAAVLRLEDRLRREVVVANPSGQRAGLTKLLSLVDAVAAFREVGLSELLPSDRIDALALKMMEQRMPGLYRALYAPDPIRPDCWWLRIMLRSPERQDAESRQRTIEQVRRIVDEEWPAIYATFPRPPYTGGKQGDTGAEDTPFISGYFVLFGVVAQSLLQAQNKTFLLALTGVGVVFWIAFRDVRLAAALVFCNVLPVLCVLGALGWCRVYVNLGVATMAAVALGLCVDSSLHYTAAYQRLLRAGIGPTRAVLRCQRLIGPPVVYATLALCAGFLSLMVSQLMPTVLLGVLLSLTMVLGLVTNVTLLPWFLLIISRTKRSRAEAPRTKLTGNPTGQGDKESKQRFIEVSDSGEKRHAHDARWDR
ncbi:MAG: efflux RND transporter permease subunit [Thermogutta sp.]